MSLFFDSSLVSRGPVNGAGGSVAAGVNQEASEWLKEKAAWDRALFMANLVHDSGESATALGGVSVPKDVAQGAAAREYSEGSDVVAAALQEPSPSGSGFADAIKDIFVDASAGEQQRLQNGWAAMSKHGDISVAELALEQRKQFIRVKLAKMVLDKAAGALKEILSIQV
ncbi:MAG: hypothetical protein LBB04_00255 [Oscillospiraceae bacterium]|nr:hypothetical protein [Oscillospiraceae bacterium]